MANQLYGDRPSIMGRAVSWLTIALAIWLPKATAVAQSTQPAPPPALVPQSDTKEGWEQIDQRMVFLVTQLASVETSIDAVNKQLRLAGYQQSARKEDAEHYRKGNELMDRNLGMPATIRWDQFYGRTAEKFFYHPTDANSSYHTQTILGQQPPQSDTGTTGSPPSRQGLPVQQRPPQFDLIYRANAQRQQQAEAEAGKLQGQKDALLDRRRQLEAEQSALWCKIAFRAVVSRDLTDKPLYRLQIKSVANEDGQGAQRAETLRAAATFVRLCDAQLEQASADVDANAAGTYDALAKQITAARKALTETVLLQDTLQLQAGDSHSDLGKLLACAKRSEELAMNISDAYRLAGDGDKAEDDQRKNTFRATLQESLMISAEAVLAADECVDAMAKKWKPVLAMASPPVDAKPIVTPALPGTSATLGAGANPPIGPDVPKSAADTGAMPNQLFKQLTLDLGNGVALKLVEIPAGKFLMGSPKDDKDRRDNEGLPPGQWENGSPQLEVTISKPFYMGITDVTVDQYAQFVKDTGTKHGKPPFKQTGDHPVVKVSWDDALAFCKWLSKKTGQTVVLPTEAQWEYACRAGRTTRFSFGDKDSDLGDYAWYNGNSGGMTHPVGQKKPNAWGLYDMHGNVWQWCSDWYGDYPGADASDPQGVDNGSARVLRGGGWGDDPDRCRAAYRGRNVPGVRDYIRVGFRVVVSATGVD